MKKTLFILATAIHLTAFAGGSSDHSHGDTHGTEPHMQSPVGQPADPANVTRTVNVSMLDTMQFVFDPELDFKSGDIVQFVVTNDGEIRHEFSIGDAQEQMHHAEMMKQMPDMVHEDGNTVTLEPGESKSITWEFSGHHTVVFACNIPGHFTAGMFAEYDLASPEGLADSTESHMQSPVGQPADPAQATSTINVALLDSMVIAFDPELDFASGDTVQFIITNNGKIRHEFSIGDAQEQKHHAEMMKQMPDMVHNDGNTVTLEPGESKSITWEFSGHHTVVFACNIPGHFTAGMFAVYDLAPPEGLAEITKIKKTGS